MLSHPKTRGYCHAAYQQDSKTAVSVSAVHIVPPDERTAAGKALRDKVPREWHGGWKAFNGRPSPIDILKKSDVGARADPLWPDAAIAFRLLSRVRRLDGFRLVASAQYGPSSSGVRRLSLDEFRRLCNARTQHHLTSTISMRRRRLHGSGTSSALSLR